MFRFRLQRVLDFRRRELDLARQRHGQAQAELLDLIAAQDRLRAQRAAFERASRDATDRPVDALQLHAGLWTLQQFEREGERLRELRQQAETKAEHARIELLAARRRMKTLENLRERRREGYEAEIRAQERIEMDEIAGRQGKNSASPETPAPALGVSPSGPMRPTRDNSGD